MYHYLKGMMATLCHHQQKLNFLHWKYKGLHHFSRKWCSKINQWNQFVQWNWEPIDKRFYFWEKYCVLWTFKEWVLKNIVYGFLLERSWFKELKKWSHSIKVSSCSNNLFDVLYLCVRFHIWHTYLSDMKDSGLFKRL